MQFSAQDYVHLVSLQMPKTMSEKNEIIFISEYAADKIAFGRQDFFQISVGIKSYNIDDVPYILKSKYDELLDRLGKVECYVIDLRREKDELSLENARLTENLAKVESELEKAKFKPSNIVISTETTYTKQNNPTK